MISCLLKYVRFCNTTWQHFVAEIKWQEFNYTIFRRAVMTTMISPFWLIRLDISPHSRDLCPETYLLLGSHKTCAICCKVIVQGCEWHWQISWWRPVLYVFYQTDTRTKWVLRHALQCGQAGSQFTLACLASGRVTVPHGLCEFFSCTISSAILTEYHRW